MGKLRSYDSVYDVNTSLNSAATELQISLKPNAEKIGLTLSEISRQLEQAYYGEEVQRNYLAMVKMSGNGSLS